MSLRARRLSAALLAEMLSVPGLKTWHTRRTTFSLDATLWATINLYELSPLVLVPHPQLHNQRLQHFRLSFSPLLQCLGRLPVEGRPALAPAF